MVQRTCLPVQGTQVQSLTWEEPTCHGATGSVGRNYWACALEFKSHTTKACVPRAHALQQDNSNEDPVHLVKKKKKKDASVNFLKSDVDCL